MDNHKKQETVFKIIIKLILSAICSLVVSAVIFIFIYMMPCKDIFGGNGFAIFMSAVFCVLCVMFFCFMEELEY